MIIFISSSPFLGGAEYQLLDLISGLVGKYKICLMLSTNSPLLNKLPKKSMRIETFEFGSTLGKFRGINIFNLKNLLRVKKLKKIFADLNKAENNLIVTTDYKELVLVKFSKGKHRHLHFQHPELPKWLRSNPILKKLVIDSLNSTDKILVDCKAVEGHLRGHGVNSKMIQVIYNGVDTDFFSPPSNKEKVSAKEKLGLQNKLIVGINARINSGKGYETLIKAFSLLVQEFKKVHLISVGGGNKFVKRKINILVKKEKLSDRISFLGNWDRSEVPVFYRALDVFTLPSETEGLPLTVIEAMLSELPTVVTNVGGMPEEVVDGRTGYVIPARDPGLLYKALSKVLSNRESSKKMGIAGRKSALSKFTKKNMIGQFIGLLNELGVE